MNHKTTGTLFVKCDMINLITGTTLLEDILSDVNKYRIDLLFKCR